jgi:hypothetical protein
MGNVRTRSAGAKVTDEEYERLEALAQASGVTLGEWCRSVLLERLDGPPPPSQAERAMLGEVMALRTILLNLLFSISQGKPVTAESMQELIGRAEAEKNRRAVEVLTATASANGAKSKTGS